MSAIPPIAQPQQAVVSLYLDHHRYLRSWLQRRLASPADAADLTHDTYVRLLGSQRFPQPEESRSWLVQIAKGLLVDLRRRRRVESAYREALKILVQHDAAPPPETHEAALEALVAIDAVLGTLSAKAREAFLLSRLDRLTYLEIAQRLNVSEASVHKYMLAAVKACRSAVT